MARHKEFEPEEALAKAVMVFWEQGYEKTSMQDLVARMGVHKRSMYDTFGDKHALFMAALDHYTGSMAAWQRDVLAAGAGPRDTLRTLLELVLPVEGRPRGCLLVNCATEVAPYDPEAARRVRRTFDATVRILEDLVRRGQQAGEFASRADPAELAHRVHNAWLGLRVQARAGVEAAPLRRLIASTLALLD